MAEKTTRVGFNAPVSLVQRADRIADLLDTSRTSLLIDALRDELDALVTDEEVQHRLKEAYYTDRIDFHTVESMLGTEEAMRMKSLRDSLDRSPPEPQVEDVDLPTQADFYSDTVPEWTPDEDEEDEDNAGMHP